MVAKTLRLIVLLPAMALVACQTIAPESGNSTILRNDPDTAIAQPVERDETASETVQETSAETEKTDDVKSRKEPEVPAVQTAPEPVKPETAPALKAPEPTPAQVITRLQQEALQLQSEGRWPEAELKLERALRINAEKVDLYHQLATVRMGQERFAEAEQIALKGLTLTDQTPKYKASLWEVIAQCRSAQGDIKGAKQARQEMLNWLGD